MIRRRAIRHSLKYQPLAAVATLASATRCRSEACSKRIFRQCEFGDDSDDRLAVAQLRAARWGRGQARPRPARVAIDAPFSRLNWTDVAEARAAPFASRSPIGASGVTKPLVPSYPVGGWECTGLPASRWGRRQISTRRGNGAGTVEADVDSSPRHEVNAASVGRRPNRAATGVGDIARWGMRGYRHV
jgi:hypothetical protein